MRLIPQQSRSPDLAKSAVSIFTSTSISGAAGISVKESMDSTASSTLGSTFGSTPFGQHQDLNLVQDLDTSSSVDLTSSTGTNTASSISSGLGICTDTGTGKPALTGTATSLGRGKSTNTSTSTGAGAKAVSGLTAAGASGNSYSTGNLKKNNPLRPDSPSVSGGSLSGSLGRCIYMYYI